MIKFKYFDYVNSKELQQEDLELCMKYNQEHDEDSFIALRNKYANLIESAINDVTSRFADNINHYVEHDDLVQEANIALLRCITRGRVDKNIENFPIILYTRVYNACNDYFGQILSLDFITCDREVNICEMYDDPYVYIKYNEIIHLILNAIEEKQSLMAKNIIIKHFGLDNGDCLSIKEVADIFNISYNSVHGIIERTYKKIRHDRNIRKMFFDCVDRKYF